MDAIDGFQTRRRHLPHWEEPEATYFVTFSLQNREEVDLADEGVAGIIVSALRHFDGVRYWLYDYVVMPDHVHAILKVLTIEGKSESLHRITHSLKSYTAHQINQRLGRAGKLWQHESYDHILRGLDDYEEKAQYIFNNPVRRELVHDPLTWPWWGRGRGR